MICPNCQVSAAISDQQYGALYTCGGCQAVYFINFEGQPEFDAVSNGESLGIDTTFESSLEPLVDSVDMVNFDNQLDAQLDAYINNDGEYSSSADVSIEAEPSLDFMNGDINPFEQQQIDKAEEQQAGAFTEVAKEISAFGNTDAHLSGLSYELQITGLDTQPIVKLFKDIIDDPRFGWDANALIRGVKNGALKIEELNPVKAYILAKRLQFLDIEKKWKQNATT